MGRGSSPPGPVKYFDAEPPLERKKLSPHLEKYLNMPLKSKLLTLSTFYESSRAENLCFGTLNPDQKYLSIQS